MYDRGEFTKLSKKKQAEKIVQNKGHLEEIARAAPQMAVLTGSDEWDKYLTYLQAMLKSIEASIEYAQENVLDPNSWDAESLTRAKMNLLKMQDRKELLEFVMTLPKELIETGEIARQQLYSLETEESSS